MIRFILAEAVLLGLFWLFARNLHMARLTGNIMYSGTNVASRKNRPKTFWSIVVFNILMLSLMAFGAIDFGLKIASAS